MVLRPARLEVGHYDKLGPDQILEGVYTRVSGGWVSWYTPFILYSRLTQFGVGKQFGMDDFFML